MRRAIAIVLDDTQREELERLTRSRTTSVRLAERAAIILHAADGLQDKEIGEKIGLPRQKAARWRKRYFKLGLAGIEKDAPRGGRKRTITENQRAMVIAKTLNEKPEGHTHWSRSTMAKAPTPSSARARLRRGRRGFLSLNSSMNILPRSAPPESR